MSNQIQTLESINLKQFQTITHDKDTNLIRFGKRDYDLTTRTWTAKDPMGYDGGDFNLYRYVLGDLVNLIDLEGENPLLVYYALEAVVYYGMPALGITYIVTKANKKDDVGKCGYNIYYYKKHKSNKRKSTLNTHKKKDKNVIIKNILTKKEINQIGNQEDE